MLRAVLAPLIVLAFVGVANAQTCPSEDDALVRVRTTYRHETTGATKDNIGTGFVVSQSGWILTAKHNVEDADGTWRVDRVALALYCAPDHPESWRPAETFVLLDSADVALIRVNLPQPPGNAYSVLPLRSLRLPDPNIRQRQFTAAGFGREEFAGPSNWLPTGDAGRRPRGQPLDDLRLGINGSFTEGHSGAPLRNEQGEAVGVVSRDSLDAIFSAVLLRGPVERWIEETTGDVSVEPERAATALAGQASRGSTASFEPVSVDVLLCNHNSSCSSPEAQRRRRNGDWQIARWYNMESETRSAAPIIRWPTAARAALAGRQRDDVQITVSCVSEEVGDPSCDRRDTFELPGEVEFPGAIADGFRLIGRSLPGGWSFSEMRVRVTVQPKAQQPVASAFPPSVAPAISDEGNIQVGAICPGTNAGAQWLYLHNCNNRDTGYGAVRVSEYAAGRAVDYDDIIRGQRSFLARLGPLQDRIVLVSLLDRDGDGNVDAISRTFAIVTPGNPVRRAEPANTGANDNCDRYRLTFDASVVHELISCPTGVGWRVLAGGNRTQPDDPRLVSAEASFSYNETPMSCGSDNRCGSAIL
jgi:hypothetical protein